MVAKDGKLNDSKIKGEPVELTKTYRMATLSFNGTGGDGYPHIDYVSGYVNTGFIDAEVLKEYIQKNSRWTRPPMSRKGEVSQAVTREDNPGGAALTGLRIRHDLG